MPRGTEQGPRESPAAPGQCVFASASCVVLDDELDFTGHGDLGALRATHEAGLQLVELDLEVARDLGEHVDVTAGRGDLEGLGALGALP